ncbi:MAG: hypothetical protein AAFV71_22385 [Cyanobacteria bacterium J06633_8]
MPKTNLCSKNEPVATNNPEREIKRLIKNDIVMKFSIGFARYLKEEFGIKNNFRKKPRDVYRPYGDLFCSISSICKEFTLQQRILPGLHNKFIVDLFELCILELMKFEKQTCFSALNLYKEWEDIKRELKTYSKNYNEPYDFESLSLNNPFAKRGYENLSLLIEYCVIVARTNRKFEMRAWKPFIKAIEDVCAVPKHKDLVTVKINLSGEIFYSKNSKRPTKRYLPQYSDEFLRNIYCHWNDIKH